MLDCLGYRETETFKVRIKSCGLDSWWYANRIGEEFEVKQLYYWIPPNEQRPQYQVVNSIKLINREDCELI